MALEASSSSLAVHMESNTDILYLKETTKQTEESSSATNSLYSSEMESKKSPIFIDDDVIMLDLLYDDKPDIIDISTFSDSSNNSDKESITFVSEFKNHEIGAKKIQPRRNPVRKARNTINICSSDEFYDDDFCLVEKKCKKTNKVINNKKTTLMKEWPLNVYERPVYNPVTKEIEKFDYSIREINEAYAIKNVAKATKKAKQVKRYGRPKRKPRIVFESKVSLEELKDCVNETTNCLKLFISKLNISENLKKVVQNQTILHSVVNIA